jgi:hypothetical protein
MNVDQLESAFFQNKNQNTKGERFSGKEADPVPAL